MSNLFHVSASPHTLCKTSTKNIMRDVAIALLPAAAFGVYNFGIDALVIILTCIVTSMLTEYIFEKCMKKPVTTSDYSALVTGLLLAMNLPATIPIWIAVIGSVFAILIVKQLFGGLGQNFMNPALAARCFLLVAFTGRMTTFPLVDSVTGATPLANLKNGVPVNVSDMFIGNIAGTIGETSVAALLLGAIYLLMKEIISWKIPFFYLLSFAVFILIFGGHGFDGQFLAAHLCGGGLMLGAFFMATDYVTSPITPMGQVVFGILLGVLTGIFRIFGNSAEGVSYAIIFCNLLVPLIEKVTMPKPFGKGALKNEK